MFGELLVVGPVSTEHILFFLIEIRNKYIDLGKVELWPYNRIGETKIAIFEILRYIDLS